MTAPVPLARSDRFRFPWLTVVIAGVTLLISVIAAVDSDVMGALVRDQPRLVSGQWWRAFTPMVVQPDGWGQLVFNVAGIAVVGAAVQRRVDNGMWLVTYVMGGVVGNVLYGAWHPAEVGGGSSAAVAALIGLLVATPPASPPASRSIEFAYGYAIFFAVYLTALDLGGATAAVVAGNLSIAATAVVRRMLGPAWMTRISCPLIILAGIVMILLRDDHGTGLLTGLAAAVVASSLDTLKRS